MGYIDINSITPATITLSDSTTGCNSTSITNTYTNYFNCYRGGRTNKMTYFDDETMKIWKLLNPDYKVSIEFSVSGTSFDICSIEEYTIRMSKELKELKRRVASTQLNWSKQNSQYTSLEFLNDMKREFDKKPCGMTSGTIYYDYSVGLGSVSLVRKRNEYEIKKVICNSAKMATTVIFEDGSVEVVKKSPDDSDADIFSVVAYAVAKHVYGSNSAFKREVLKNLDFIDREFEKIIDRTSCEDLTKAMRKLVEHVKKRNKK